METIYRFLVRLTLPRHFRRRYAASLLEAFRAEAARPRNRGPMGRVLFAHEVLGDLAVAAVRVWSRSLPFLSGLPVSRVALAGTSAAFNAPSFLPEDAMHTANDRLRDRESSRFWVSLLVSTALHAGFFYGFPTMSAAVEATPDPAFTMVAPPDVPLPPAPEAVQRPARPVMVAGADVDVVPLTVGELWDRAPDLPPPPRAEETAARPSVWTGPVQYPPRLVNRGEVEQALESHYPALLREAGIGGRVRVSFFVIDDGTVFERRILESSGHGRLDDAALSVADVMRFSPAMNRDTPVSVWVTFPIEFTTRR